MEIAIPTILGIAALICGWWLLAQIWQIVVMVVIALMLASALAPAVAWLEARGAGRPTALGLTVASLALAFVGLAAIVLPEVIPQARDLLAAAPDVQIRLADALARVPLTASLSTRVRAASLDSALTPVGAYVVAHAGPALDGVSLAATTVVLAVYLLADRERARALVFSLAPRPWHARLTQLLRDLDTMVGGYVRGQALTSAMIGAFVSALLAVIGTPGAIALGVLAAFTDLIPFVGGTLALAPAVLATLTVGIPQALVVLVAIQAYQQLESHVLVPRVYGRTMRLSPVTVVLALLIGGKLMGIVGALLALPVAAGIRVVVEDLGLAPHGSRPEASPGPRSESAVAPDVAARLATDEGPLG